MFRVNINRFAPIAEKVFVIIEDCCNSKDVSSAVALIHAMRSLRLDVCFSNYNNEIDGVLDNQIHVY